MAKILIVDDNIQNNYMLESLLKDSGHEILTANNGKTALESAKKDKPDIIISDILMPVMDGFELCRLLKTDNELFEIPFIFYTATYTEEKDEKFAHNLGTDRFIVKPQKPEIILGIVNEVLFHKLEKKVKVLEEEIVSRKKTEKALIESRELFSLLFE